MIETYAHKLKILHEMWADDHDEVKKISERVDRRAFIRLMDAAYQMAETEKSARGDAEKVKKLLDELAPIERARNQVRNEVMARLQDEVKEGAGIR